MPQQLSKSKLHFRKDQNTFNNYIISISQNSSMLIKIARIHKVSACQKRKKAYGFLKAISLGSSADLRRARQAMLVLPIDIYKKAQTVVPSMRSKANINK